MSSASANPLDISGGRWYNKPIRQGRRRRRCLLRQYPLNLLAHTIVGRRSDVTDTAFLRERRFIMPPALWEDTMKNQIKSNTNSHLRLTLVIAAAICIAMSYGLSYIKLFSMPLGGSVTPASMLPLSLFAYLFGPWWGMLAGAVYGVLQLLQRPEIVHWAQLLLDFPVAFAAIGLAGTTRRMRFHDGFAARLGLPLGTLIGGFVRFVCHTLSGAIFFAEYAGEQNAWLYSLIYNGAYLGVDLAICVAAAFFIPTRRIFSQLSA